jgi:hypothetical protein
MMEKSDNMIAFVQTSDVSKWLFWTRLELSKSLFPGSWLRYYICAIFLSEFHVPQSGTMKTEPARSQFLSADRTSLSAVLGEGS